MKVTLSRVAAAAILILMISAPLRAPAQDSQESRSQPTDTRGIKDTIKDDAKTLGQDIHKGAHEVADKSRQVGHAVADSTRAAGKTISADSRKAGQAVRHGAQEVGHSVKNGANKAKSAVSGSKSGAAAQPTEPPKT
jgi:hypothetical protein